MGSRVAAVAAFVVFVAACGAQQSVTTATDPGITKDEIKIGGTYAMSGPASYYASVAKGALAYFAYINAEKGGVNGRKINYIVLDDAYDSSKTPDKARELVQDQKVFATFGNLGTPSNKAVRDYYNAQKVPQLFVFTGASIWGTEYDKYPYTLGWQPDYVTEATIFAKGILQLTPNAKIAILYQNDAFGQDGWQGFRTALGDKASTMIVKEANYNTGDPQDMRSQVNALKASGADTFVVFATPGYAASAVTNAYTSGWKPKQIIVNQVAASTVTWRGVAKLVGSSAPVDGMLSTRYLKDQNAAEWANDPGIAQYKTILEKYGKDCPYADNFCTSGMAFAFSVVDVLKKAGNNLTRANVVKIAAEQMNETDNFLLVPGITVRTSKTHRFPISQLQSIKWSGDHWEAFGPIIEGRP
ncbi:MAG: ABC transporter substrate-binding protein [Candidatus Dormibacteraceae bacterium]